MITVETIITNISVIMTIIAVLCLIITVITEFTKEIGFLKKIPTSLQVLTLSLIVCITTFFAYLSYASLAFIWYYLLGVVFGSFVVALICTKGWDYVFEIWNRYNIKK